MTNTRFLKVTEVAEVMRVSKMTVYRLIDTGRLEAVRAGRCLRIHEDEFHDYLRGDGRAT